MKFTGSLGLAVVAAFAAAGCGDEEVKVPSGAVAQVGDVVIDRAAYDERFAITAAYQLSRPPPYDPTNLKRCAAFKTGERPAEGQKPPTRAELIRQCEEQLADFKTRTMQSLVLAQWLDQEAADKGLRVSSAEVRKELVKTTTTNFGSPKGYARFQRTTKIPESFFLEQARGAVLTRKLTERAGADAPKASTAEVDEYFRANRKEFSQPERRSVRLLVARSQAKAAGAHRELKSGSPWKQVVNAYVTDPAQRTSSLKPVELTRTGLNKKFEQAVFRASAGTLGGPLKTPYGWFVFEVDKIHPATKAVLNKRNSRSIKARLSEAKAQQALESYTEDFGSRYQAKTTCADGYRIAECRNPPSVETTPETTPETTSDAPSRPPSANGLPDR
jgi:foldase protein PrsA